MKRRILSVILAMFLCISSHSVAQAQQKEVSVSGPVTRDSTVPTPTEVYEAMTALQDREEYKEGTIWTNDEPYSDSKGYYHWKGGTLGGYRISAVGCVAFAFILSDEAFGSLPARMYAAGSFTFDDIKVGDILRVNNDAHTVIVLEVSDAGVLVAEGNISTGDHIGKVHWGRAISKEEVMGSTSHYITRYPEGYVSPDDPEANVSIAKGTLEGGLTWNLTKAGTLTVSGEGAMPDFSSTGEQPWNENSSQIRKIVIGNGVTNIGSCAFWNCGVLSAEISSSVTTIGDSAFRQCQNLSSVTISQGVETIGQNAFRACTSLTSIALPASIGEVGSAAFFQCTELTIATFAPGSRQVKMGDNIFTQCYYLMSVTLPKSIDRIGEGMFQNCRMLAGLEIPQGAESIEASAFASCSALTTVIIPESVTSIGFAAFSSCSLTNIYFTGTEERWNSVSKLGDTAAALSEVEMHYNYVPPVSPGPDDGDDNDNDNNDGNKPGNGDNPGSGDDPGNSDKPGTGDNAGNGGNPGDISAGAGGGSGNAGGQMTEQKPLAQGKTFTAGNNTYKVTKAGQEVELTTITSTAAKVMINTVTGTDGVKYKVTSIRSKAMQNNKKMTSLIMGTNVKKIGADAFSGCTKLTTVTFGKNTVSIGTRAFKGCAALKKAVILPDSVRTIGAGAFSGCKKITAFTIGKTSKSKLTTIGKGAFSGCRRLGKVTVKSIKLSSVGKQAFKGSKSGLKVKVPSKKWKKYKKIFKKAGLKDKQIKK